MTSWRDREIMVAPAERGGGQVLHAVRGLPPRWLLEQMGLDPDEVAALVPDGHFSLCEAFVTLVSVDDQRRRPGTAGEVTCQRCRGILREKSTDDIVVTRRPATTRKAPARRTPRATEATGQMPLFIL